MPRANAFRPGCAREELRVSQGPHVVCPEPGGLGGRCSLGALNLWAGRAAEIPSHCPPPPPPPPPPLVGRQRREGLVVIKEGHSYSRPRVAKGGEDSLLAEWPGWVPASARPQAGGRVRASYAGREGGREGDRSMPAREGGARLRGRGGTDCAGVLAHAGLRRARRGGSHALARVWMDGWMDGDGWRWRGR